MSTNSSGKSSNKGSLFEQLKDTTRNELSAMGKLATNSVMGRLSNNNSSAAEGNRAYPPLSPERMAPERKLPQKKTPEVMLFSWAERYEAMQVNEQIKSLLKLIREEISALEQQNKGLVAEAAKLTVEQLPENPGIYHIRFLEWILRTLKDIRQKVSESATWFNLLQGKRKKMGFWGKAKKHGTSFTLSGERTAATQSG